MLLFGVCLLDYVGTSYFMVVSSYNRVLLYSVNVNVEEAKLHYIQCDVFRRVPKTFTSLQIDVDVVTWQRFNDLHPVVVVSTQTHKQTDWHTPHTRYTLCLFWVVFFAVTTHTALRRNTQFSFYHWEINTRTESATCKCCKRKLSDAID